MAIEITKIGGYTAPNIGYIGKIYLLPKSDVLEVIDSYRKSVLFADPRTVLNGHLVLDPTAVCYEVGFPPKSAQLRVVERIDRKVTVWEYSITGDMPGVQKTLLSVVDKHPDNLWVVVMIDNNGNAWLAGNETWGLTLKIGQIIGADNTIPIELTGTLNVPLMALESNDLTEILPVSAFSGEFSTDFDA